MFHMLTSFNLQPSASLDEFQQFLRQFTAHLKKIGLLDSTGAVGRRQRHPIMDTDDDRDHEFYFTMSFQDRAQCDHAVDYIYGKQEPVESVHKSMYALVKDPIFTCWEDL